MRAVLLLLCNVLCMTLFAQVRAVRSGNWSDPNTWGGKNPGTNDKVVIPKEFTINYDAALVTISGLDLEGTLSFDASKSSTLQSSKNIHVKGSLIMKPSAVQQIHTLRFVDVNESKYVGDGMNILDSDVGLWVSGMGVLDLVGTSKSTGWTNATDGMFKGQTQVNLKQNASWQVGDEIVLTPTESSKLENYQDNFDLNQIKSISGSSVTMQSGLLYNHPKVNNTYTPEVLNLTRNVRIEGTANGRAHIMITSMKVQNVRWAQIRYMGPRKFRDGDNTPDMIPGRYGLHFHHMMNGSRGTMVEGVVIRDCGNHSFVPHSSNGITFKNNITYNTYEDAYWWDPQHPTYDIVFDGNVAAKVLYIPRSKGLDVNGHPMLAVNAFLLGMGQGNKAVNNVAVGVKGSREDFGAAFVWEADNEGVWEFTNNVAHNSVTGIRTWQNTNIPHKIERFTSYNNQLGLFHGAYFNNYRYVGCTFFEGGILLKAVSGGDYSMRFEHTVIDQNGLHDHGITLIHGAASGSRPTLFRDVTVTNYRKSAVLYDIPVNDKLRLVDFVFCDLGPNEIFVKQGMIRNDRIRVQPKNGSSYQVTNAGKSTIQPFAPLKWGNGSGLKSEYFGKIDLTGLTHVETDPVIHYNLLTPKLNYRITDKMNYSIRWSGLMEAQVSEEVIFHLRSGGGHRLWINDKVVMDDWRDKYIANFSSKPVLLEAGKKYSIKLEYFNTNDTRSGAILQWSSRSMPMEVIPQSQLYASTIEVEIPNPTPEPEPEPQPEPTPDSVPQSETNLPPVANAGPDVTINIPAITVSLSGDQSTDPENNIVLYEWNIVSGKSKAWIENKAAKNTRIRSLEIGTYVIRLKVTDHMGLTSVDEKIINVKAQRTEAEISAEFMEAMDVKAANKDLSVFPNPAGNTINLQLNNEISGQGFVNIFDVSGKLVKKSQLAKNHSFVQQSIDISSLRPGLFHLEVVIGKDLREVADFIKQ